MILGEKKHAVLMSPIRVWPYIYLIQQCEDVEYMFKNVLKLYLFSASPPLLPGPFGSTQKLSGGFQPNLLGGWGVGQEKTH